ncbi:MAG: hypothetical protein WA792_04810 [Pseudolabrys sp.]
MLGKMFAAAFPNQKGYVGAPFDQPPTEITSNGAGTQTQNTHDFSSWTNWQNFSLRYTSIS